MNKIELSLHLEASYPAKKSSIDQRKPVYGVGVNDADYMITQKVNGVRLWDPAYKTWSNMMQRAYSERYHATHPTYSDVTVCAEWHSFSAFRNWWLNSYREDWQCDKDLLAPGNREYSHNSCIYVPRWLNSFLNDHRASRGEFPIGVCLCKQTGMYRSHCKNTITGKERNLGRFATPEAANVAWRRYKLSLADKLKPEMDAIDKRIYQNVVKIIKAAE